MSRAQRLLGLLEILRRYRHPVTGSALAAELGISQRSLYRDIAILQSQGARWVADRTDESLARAARNALAKIATVLPPAQRDDLDSSTLLIPPGSRPPGSMGQSEQIAALRKAIRGEQKISLTYRDGQNRESVRTAWPFALAFFDSVRVVVAWCELRQDFRDFRTDRIARQRPGGADSLAEEVESLEASPVSWPDGPGRDNGPIPDFTGSGKPPSPPRSQ